MEIEDLIDNKSRLEQGIFFTKHHIVDQIINKIDLTKAKSVLDSAAGSCNFLIPLAKIYPNINFFGVEKNEIIYKEVLLKIKDLPNIKYFHGDIILDSFKIPKCDIYIGNPPFINYSDLGSNYREKIKDIWLSYFPKSKGFKMLLGDSRGDISQLIFYITVDRYLKDSGQIGVVLPNSLIKGNSASAGFRDFKNIKVKSFYDISYQNPFDNTTRNCFYILANKGGKTSYPITYFLENKTVGLIKVNEDLIEDGFSILKTSPYVARQGVNTLGANSIYIFKDKIPFKSELLKPLLKSSDINPFNYTPSYNILFPYIKGKLITEETMQIKYKMEYNYLLDHKDVLINRKSRFAQKNWFALFGVGEYTNKKYKVVWRGLGAKELVVAVTKNVIPNQAMNCYISTNSENEAHYICGVMNSNIYKKQLSLLNETGAKSFAQPNTINKIYIPLFNNDSLLHKEIFTCSMDLHLSNIKNTKLLNNLVNKLYVTEGFI